MPCSRCVPLLDKLIHGSDTGCRIHYHSCKRTSHERKKWLAYTPPSTRGRPRAGSYRMLIVATDSDSGLSRL